jgi:hypothetical protein
MTAQEHKLMFLMFAKQAQYIKTLVSILTSRGILQEDDAAAFHFATLTDVPANAVLLREVREQYLSFAISTGLNLDAVLEATQVAPEPTE